jgi:Mg2+ and Co2+ transporter CorA
MYGCSFAIEQNIIGRLKYIASEAAHPLLLPGILVELELSRHIKLIESTINKVEAKIFELDFDYANLGRPKSDVDDRNEEKREAWLDLTYLRNGLIISDCSGKDCMVSALRNWSKHSDGTMPKAIGPLKKPTWDVSKPKVRFRKTPEVYKRDMQQVGERIKARLSAIRDEYDEKIRDCTMRVDGMAMATQWSHGETNVEIALATNQDSKVMRSIALVTMVFLPGTFFGTVFSMTFFNWSGDGKARISSYLWIYVVITVVFTLMTVGLWYFLVVYRKKRSTAESGNSA